MPVPANGGPPMRSRLRERLPVLVFVLITLFGWGGAAALLAGANRTETARFAGVVDEATNRIGERLRLHMLAIEATAAIIEALGDNMTAPRFAEYFEKLRLAERNPGIAGLGFAPLLRPDELPALARRLEANYGRPVEIWPQTTDDLIAPVVILGSPDAEPPQAVGYDMYSEPTRRAALDAAIAARAPRVTEPLKLAMDASPLAAFIVFAPVYTDSFGIARRTGEAALPTGFAFGGFRIGDLVGAALHVLPLLPVALTIADADTPDTALYAYGAAAAPSAWTPEVEMRQLEVADQTWRLVFRPSVAYRHAMIWPLALGFGVISTALALAAALALRGQAQARTSAEALAATSQRSLAERDLLLQEMKHRIKNAIARILAIARQTAAGARSVEAFTDSFTRRLQAMADAQDLLTRTGTASLLDLLTRELVQVFGEDFQADRLRGPKVDLDAEQTRALGLVFHELATNALKHGGAGSHPPAIDVSWSLSDGAGAPRLDLCWRESGGRIVQPAGFGFGTKLIDASLRHELGGEVEREWTPDGLVLQISLPLVGHDVPRG